MISVEALHSATTYFIIETASQHAEMPKKILDLIYIIIRRRLPAQERRMSVDGV